MLWLTLMSTLTLGCAGGDEAHDAHAVHWGYGQDDGPGLWASLNVDWAICGNGRAQSPIDLRDAEDA